MPDAYLKFPEGRVRVIADVLKRRGNTVELFVSVTLIRRKLGNIHIAHGTTKAVRIGSPKRKHQQRKRVS